MRILVVDDEQLLVKGIKFNLENDGYTVDGVYDGKAALELGEKELEAGNKGLRHRIFGAICRGEIDGFKPAGSKLRTYGEE